MTIFIDNFTSKNDTKCNVVVVGGGGPGGGGNCHIYLNGPYALKRFHRYFVLAVNGDWGLWSGFSACTSSCGGGTQTRTRLCDDPEPSNGGRDCPGLSSESNTCNTQECPGKFKGNREPNLN